MYRRILVVMAALLLGAAASAAQSPAPPDPEAEATFADIRFQADTELDPTLVTVIASGETPASGLLAECVGSLPSAPSATVTLDAGVPLLRLFFYSDSDTIMAIQSPAGDVQCSDDSAPGVLDPSIDFIDAEPGRYTVFVGTFDPDQRTPGFLVITADNQLTTSDFNLVRLVERASQDITAAQPPLADFDLSLLALNASDAAETLTLEAGFETVEREVTGGGEIPTLSLDALGSICNGNISATPSLFVTIESALPAVRVFFNGTSDATLLIVQLTDNQYACNDDALGGLNPLLEFSDVQPGSYAVFVGSFDPLQTVTGTLVVTEDTSRTPEMLTPAAPGQ